MDMKRIVWVGGLITVLALAGCNGNGNGGGMAPVDPVPQDVTLDVTGSFLQDNSGNEYNTVTAGDYAIDPGQSSDAGDVTFSCPAGGAACAVTVAADGTVTYKDDGGVPTVAPSQAATTSQVAAAFLQDNSGMEYNTVTAGSYEIQAGESSDAGDVTFSCPAGGAACAVTVADDGTVMYDGGLPTVAASQAATTAQVSAAFLAADKAGNEYNTVTAGSYEIQAGESSDAGDVTFSCPAGGAACKVTVADDGTVTYEAGVPTVAASQAAVDARMAANDAFDAAVLAARLALAKGIDAAITAAADDRPQTLSSQNDLNEGKLAVTTGSGNDAKIDNIRETDNLGDDFNQFTKSADAAMLTKFDGLGTGVYERENGAVKDTITLYTNEEESKNQAFETYYGENGAGLGADAQGSVLGTNPYSTENKDLTFTFTRGVDLTAGQASWFQSTSFPGLPSTTDGEATRTYSADNNGAARTFAGQFNGINGNYTCSATGTAVCSVTTKGNGAMSFAGTWKFKPDSEKAELTGVIKDTDYLQFGYWLQATTDAEDGTVTYGLRTFAGGAQDFDVSAMSAVEGTATYTGSAVGQYVRREFSSDGVPTPVQSGPFIADAKLDAYFGGGNVAPNLKYSIKGTVNNFRHEGGASIIPADADYQWEVTLGSAGFVDKNDSFNQDDYTNYKNTVAGTTMTGGNDNAGDWTATFFGPSANSAQPSGVAGTFDANFQNGSVNGAFGAEKD